MRRIPTLLSTLALVWPLTGCVERTISISSEPSGALVHLNDEEVGRTPLTVPFTFYGTYSVRVTHEPVWVSPAQAAALLGVEEGEIVAKVKDGSLPTREVPGNGVKSGEEAVDATGGQAIEEPALIEVPVYYQPLWTNKGASAPLWDYPGVDLLAEAVPDNEVALKWHFVLQPSLPAEPETLVDHARQMRGLIPQGKAQR